MAEADLPAEVQVEPSHDRDETPASERGAPQSHSADLAPELHRVPREWGAWLIFLAGVLPLLLVLPGEMDFEDVAWTFGLYFAGLWGMVFYSLLQPVQLGRRYVGELAAIWLFVVFAGIPLLLGFSHVLEAAFSDLRGENLLVRFLTLSMVVGLPEEAIKLLPVLVLARWRSPYRSGRQIAFAGVISGLAFGVNESVLYNLANEARSLVSMLYFGAGYGSSERVITMMVRLITTPFIHVIWTVILSLVFVVHKSLPRKPRRSDAVFVSWLIVGALHGAYDAVAGEALSILVLAASFGGLLYVLKLDKATLHDGQENASGSGLNASIEISGETATGEDGETGLWYYTRSGFDYGPVSHADFLAVLHNEGLAPDELVWTEGLDTWHSLRSLQSIAPERLNGIADTDRARVLPHDEARSRSASREESNSSTIPPGDSDSPASSNWPDQEAPSESPSIYEPEADSSSETEVSSRWALATRTKHRLYAGSAILAVALISWVAIPRVLEQRRAEAIMDRFLSWDRFDSEGFNETALIQLRGRNPNLRFWKDELYCLQYREEETNTKTDYCFQDARLVQEQVSVKFPDNDDDTAHSSFGGRLLKILKGDFRELQSWHETCRTLTCVSGIPGLQSAYLIADDKARRTHQDAHYWLSWGSISYNSPMREVIISKTTLYERLPSMSD